MTNTAAAAILAKVPVGHVDTWQTWTFDNNSAVLDAVDFIGTDAYPYYESTDIGNAKTTFDTAMQAVSQVAGGKPIWVTETGWPSAGPNWGPGVPSPQNAQSYWDAVGCGYLFGHYNTWWFDSLANAATGLTFTLAGTNPAIDLTCSSS